MDSTNSATVRLRQEDRNARQQLAGWSPERLSKARVVVAGAGAIGNEIIKNSVLIGVGTIVVIDFDHVAPSNLTRCVLMGDEDVGQPKADVVARRAGALNPRVRVLPINGDLEFDLGDRLLLEADVVVGALDNAYARYVLSSRMRSLGRGWIDTAISADAAQITILGAGGACYACGIGQATLDQMARRFSCTGFRKSADVPTVPTTVVTAALVGALATDLLVEAIHGRARGAGHRWTLLLRSARWMDSELTVGDLCPFHGKRQPVRGVAGAGLRIQETWSDVSQRLKLSDRSWLKLRHPTVIGLRCPHCRLTVDVIGPQRRLGQEVEVCQSCRLLMIPSIHDRLDNSSPASVVPLRDLGYAAGDILEIHDGRRVRRVWLDAPRGWEQQRSPIGGRDEDPSPNG